MPQQSAAARFRRGGKGRFWLEGEGERTPTGVRMANAVKLAKASSASRRSTGPPAGRCGDIDAIADVGIGAVELRRIGQVECLRTELAIRVR